MTSERRQFVGHTLAIGAVFLLAGAEWLSRSWAAIPADYLPEDGCLILWVLDWVRSALSTAPGSLFDPPVNYPAPHQLTGSESFFASQLLYLPLHALTGRPVAAANLTAFSSYVLAALIMYALLRALAIEGWAALGAAIVYGLGYEGGPGRLHILQNQHLVFPLAALAIHRLRAQPTAARSVVLAAALCAGMLSSYYMAVYALLGTGVWGIAELWRAGPDRTRYAGWATLAAGIAVATALAVSIPYLTRPEALGGTQQSISPWGLAHLREGGIPLNAQALPASALAKIYAAWIVEGGSVPEATIVLRGLLRNDWLSGLDAVRLLRPALMLLAVVSAIRGRGGMRWLAVVGLSLVVVGVLISGPLAVVVGGVDIPLPRAALAATLARFIRAPSRGLSLVFFGSALLLANGLHVASRWLGRWGAVAGLSTAALLTMHFSSLDTSDGAFSVSRWFRLAPATYLDNPALGADAETYVQVRRVVERIGPGPLLDLPLSRDGTAVVGQMLHRQPNISFYSGYQPAHVSIVDRLIAELPDAAALEDLVDVTHLTWILLRDDSAWPDPTSRQFVLNGLRSHPRVVAKLSVGNYVLLQLDPTPRHPQWFQTIREGPRPGFSPLGAALVPLPHDTAPAFVRLDAARHPRPGELINARVTLWNGGRATWPAGVPENPDIPFTVRLQTRWVGPDDLPEEEETYELIRDVPAGERCQQRISMAAPRAAGRYRLEARVYQVQGSDLASPLNPVGIDVEVVGVTP